MDAVEELRRRRGEVFWLPVDPALKYTVSSPPEHKPPSQVLQEGSREHCGFEVLNISRVPPLLSLGTHQGQSMVEREWHTNVADTRSEDHVRT